MSYKRIWIISFVAAFVSWGLFLICSHSSITGLPYNSNALSMSAGWTISDGEKNIYENSNFDNAGRLKKQNKAILTKLLPETSGKSICFTTIGYIVEAFIDGQRIYTFGSSPNGYDVWGTKTHIVKIPDGGQGRVLRLEFSTNHPLNIAVSKHVLLDDEFSLTNSLLKSSLVEICFSLLYISIGVFVLMYLSISFTFRFRGVNLSFLMLALIALLMGSRLLFNIAFVTLHTGPEFTFWSLHLLNLSIPIPALLFAAADKAFKKSGLLIAMAVVQSVFLLLWVIFQLVHTHIFLLYWQLPLFVLVSAVFLTAFIREFLEREGRLMVTAAVLAVLTASVINAQIYFCHGNYYSMDYNLGIYTFPVLILLIGKVALNSAQRELRIMDENTTLRVEGELLFENYNKLDQHIEGTKKIWHDIDKHYSVMGRMLAEGEYDELKSYFKSMGHDMKEAKSAYFCDNRLINAILTDKIAEAESKGIQVSVTGNLPKKLCIQGNDLCSLFVNMLDNAIEACMKISNGGEKKIHIALKMKKDFVYFNVVNSSAPAPERGGGKPATSKEDGENHGYGIAIMQKIARKYNGAFKMISSEASFMVRVALKNESVEDTHLG